MEENWYEEEALKKRKLRKGKIVIITTAVVGTVVGYKIGFNRGTNRQIKTMVKELDDLFLKNEIACLDEAGKIMPGVHLKWRQFK
jgi:hypothetical protein